MVTDTEGQRALPSDPCVGSLRVRVNGPALSDSHEACRNLVMYIR